MSFELDYLPPKCGRYEWYHKTMNYSCWSLGISEKLRELRVPAVKSIWPMNITCKVDFLDSRYWWLVSATDWEFGRSETSGWADTAEEAICKAEEIGERYWDQLVKDWMREALQNGWRPPSTPSIAYGSSPKAFSLNTQHEPASLMDQQLSVECWCQECCKEQTGSYHMFRMVLCPECGNKRCPKASNHELACTGSNEPGQGGSVYS